MPKKKNRRIRNIDLELSEKLGPVREYEYYKQQYEEERNRLQEEIREALEEAEAVEKAAEIVNEIGEGGSDTTGSSSTAIDPDQAMLDQLNKARVEIDNKVNAFESLQNEQPKPITDGTELFTGWQDPVTLNARQFRRKMQDAWNQYQNLTEQERDELDYQDLLEKRREAGQLFPDPLTAKLDIEYSNLLRRQFEEQAAMQPKGAGAWDLITRTPKRWYEEIARGILDGDISGGLARGVAKLIASGTAGLIYGPKKGGNGSGVTERLASNLERYLMDTPTNQAIMKNELEISSSEGELNLAREKSNYLNAANQLLDNTKAILDLLNSIYDGSYRTDEEYDAIENRINILVKANNALLKYVKNGATYDYDAPLNEDSEREIVVGHKLENGKWVLVKQKQKPIIVGYVMKDGSVGHIHDTKTNLYLQDIYNIYKSANVGTPKFDNSKLELLVANAQEYKNKFGKWTNYVDNTLVPDIKKRIEDDQEELNRWHRFHKVSDYTKKKIEESQDMDFLDIDTYLYGLPNVLGSSAANNGWLLLSSASRIAGSGLLYSKHPGAMIAGGILLGVGLGAGIVSAESENYGEVGSKYKENVTKRLAETGLHNLFINDWKKQTNKNGGFDDAWRDYMSGKYQIRNHEVDKVFTSTLWGANNAFQDDMVATYGSEIFETIFSTTTPLGGKALGGVFGNVGKYFGRGSALGVGGGLLAIPVGYAAKYGKKVFDPVISKLSSRTDFLYKWLAANPNRFAKTELAKNIVKFAAQEAGIGLSESIEEGKQHEVAERFTRGEYAGDKKSLVESVMDDVMTGARSAYTFLGNTIFGMEADEDLLAEMRGGFLAPFGNAQSMIALPGQFGQIYHEYTSDQLVGHNMMLLKLHDDININSYTNYARAAMNKNKFAAMNQAFDRMKEIQERAGESALFKPEDIEEQRKVFNRVAQLANSDLMKSIAKSKGISPKSAEYATYVALYQYGQDLMTAANNGYEDMNNQINGVLDNVIISDEKYKLAFTPSSSQMYNLQSLLRELNMEDRINVAPRGLDEDEDEYLERRRREYINQAKNTIDGRRAYEARLSELHAILELINLLESVENRTKALDDELKFYHQVLKEYRESFSETDKRNTLLDKIDSIEDVLKRVKDKESHDTLRKLYRQQLKFSNDLREASVFTFALNNDIDMALMSGIANDVNSSWNAARKVVSNKKIIFDEHDKAQGKDDNAKKLIDQYNKRLKKDSELIQRIWDSYYKSIDERNKEDQQVRETQEKFEQGEDTTQIDEERKQDDPMNEINNREETLNFLSQNDIAVGDRIGTSRISAITSNGYVELTDDNGKSQSYSKEDVLNLKNKSQEEFVQKSKKELTEEQLANAGINIGDTITIPNAGGYVVDFVNEDGLVSVHDLQKPETKGTTTPEILVQALIDEERSKSEAELHAAHNENAPTIPLPEKVESKPEPAAPANETIVQKTEAQSRVEQQINDIIQNQKHTATTGQDHFFIEDGKIIRYNRVHSAIDLLYGELMPTMVKPSIRQARQTIIDNLIKLFDNKEEYYKEIDRLQEEYNKALAEKYGKDSGMYEEYHIDLSIYKHPDLANDRGCIRSIANIAAVGEYNGVKEIDIPIRSVTGGKIIDDICRDVFSGKEVVFDTKYGMPEDVFNKLIADIKARKAAYEQDGYVLITSNVKWHSTFIAPNGQPIKIAGETDMIGIDKDGHIKIIDFKTSRSSFYQLQEKTIKGTWANVRPGESVDEDIETRVFNLALDIEYEHATRTTRDQYLKQLTMYLELILDLLKNGVEVTSIELLPFYVRIACGKNEVTGEYDRTVFGGFESNTVNTNDEKDSQPKSGGKVRANAADYVEMQQPVPLRIDETVTGGLTTIENYEEVNMDGVENSSQELRTVIDTLNQKVSANQQQISAVTKNKIQQVNSKIQALGQRYLELKNNVHRRTNPGSVDALERDIKDLINVISDLLVQIDTDVAETNALAAPVVQSKDPTITSRPSDPENRFRPHELMVKGMALRFSMIAQPTVDNVKDSAELKRCAVLPDFAEKAVVELDVEQYLKTHGTSNLSNGMKIYVTISYNEPTNSGTIHHEWKGLRILPQTQDENGQTIEARNGELVKAIDSILYTTDPKTGAFKINEKARKNGVVLKGMLRTNGKTKYGGKNDLKDIRTVFNLTKDDVKNLLTGIKQGFLGVVSAGLVARVAHNSKEKRIGEHAFEPGRELVDGMMVFEMYMNYDEDKGDAWKHQVPIVLTPKQLGDSDVDLIIRCLQNYYGKDKITINGKEYDSPLSNRQLLRTLVRFGVGADVTGNNFVFRFTNLDNENRPIDTNSVTIQYLDRSDENNPKVVSRNYDIRDSKDVHDLKETLKTFSVYYNNEYGMWHNTSEKKDPNKDHHFSGIDKFFKTFDGTEGREKIDRIEFSESMVFDRSDVDPNGDGSYEGVTGAEWMVNHGWMLTNFQGIDNPAISFADAEEIKPSITPKEEKMAKTVEELSKADPEVEGERTTVSDMLIDESVYENQEDDPDLGEDPFLESRRKAGKEVTYAIDREQAIKRISKILGKNFPVEFVEGLIDVTDDGWETVGMLKNASIILSDLAENGVEYHEAFHAVVELLMSPKRRKILYDTYRSKYGKNLTDDEVSEGLADLFWEFRRQTGEFTFDKNKIGTSIINFFTTLWKWVKAIYNLKSYRLANAFVAASRGKWANKKISQQQIDDFKARFKGVRRYSVRNKKGDKVQFRHFNNARQLDDAIDYLVYRLISGQSIDRLGLNIDKLHTGLTFIKTRIFLTEEDKKNIAKFDKEQNDKQREADAKKEDYTKEVYTVVSDGFKLLTGENLTEEQLQQLSPEKRRNMLMLRELFDEDHWGITQEKIKDKLESFGIKSKRMRDKLKREELEGGDPGTNAAHEDIEGHSDEFYAHSMSDDVSASIRFLLSTIPNVRYATEADVKAGRLDHAGRPLTAISHVNKDGEVVRHLVSLSNNSLGYTEFASFLTVYLKLLKLFHDARNVEDLDRKLTLAGQNDPIIKKVARSFHNFRYKSYIRYVANEKAGIPKEYSGIPMVFDSKGKLMPVDYYISDTNNITDEEKFMTRVVAVRDIEEDGKVICKAGEIIPGAQIVTNPDFESYTTQIFQAIKSQKLNFTYCYGLPVVDENNNKTGGYTYSTNSTNVELAQRNYPHSWFNNMRSMLGDILTKDSKDKTTIFSEAKTILLSIASQLLVQRQTIIKVQNKLYDISNLDGFDSLLNLFVAQLNNIGISVDVPMITYMLQNNYPEAKDIQTAFRSMFASREKNSIQPFIKDGGILDTIQKAFDSKDFSKITQDVSENKQKNISDSGAFLYSNNGFIKFLSLWFGRYRAAAVDMMAIGPENTKLYMYAQNHTVSDLVDEYNAATVDEEENVIGSETLKDLKDVDYISHSVNGVRIGSIIVKSLLDPKFNPDHNKLVLETSSGIKLYGQHDGGTKYSKITAREDWLLKADILSKGHIIFPTLSDKSTWFYLTGIKVPGYDWSNIGDIKVDQIPYFSVSGRMFFRDEDKKESFGENAQLDQLVEYALCDYKSALRVLDLLNRNEIPDGRKVKNFHTGDAHGARLAFLTGVYDEDGNFISFNNNKKTPEECLAIAGEYFFNRRDGETEDQLRARQRYHIARILQHRLDEALDNLVEKGIIERVPKDVYTTVYPDSTHRMPADGKKANMPHHYGYRNKYLDEEKIKYLASVIAKRKYPGQQYTYGDRLTQQQLESLAICAYVNDINVRSNISLQETLRMFTGMPHFFKWKYGKDGRLMDVGNDESKRYGGTGSTGTNNRDDLPNIETDYTCAEVKDWEIPSPMQKLLTMSFEDNEYRDALVQALISSGTQSKKAYDEVYNSGLSLDDVKIRLKELIGDDIDILDDKIKSETKSYKEGINVADGTAFITDTMAENLLRQRGVYSKLVQEAFEYLRGKRKIVYKGKDGKDHKGHYLTDNTAYRIIFDAMISTQKYSAFGYRMEYGIPVHYYNKFALFPLFEGISYGFTYDLYKKMKEEGVDMVMFDSAVKSGSEGAQAFNPDMYREDNDPTNDNNFISGDAANQDWKPARNIEDFTFKGRIYKQKYRFIRRQLNTDPRTDEIMAIGTQARKVALSTVRDDQTYEMSDGSIKTGIEIRDQIMRLTNEISDIGLERIKKQFLKEDGTLDIEAFHSFIKGELMQRNADKNILDAIELVYNKDENGENIPGTARFKCPLNSVSNMRWIESIVISQINKEVVDINLPGNAYYQRSVFGMEGRPRTIMSDDLVTKYQINNGNPLLVINEEGSMDAVISIDYFMHIIPENIRYNFTKARQWLIDNEIIGPKAKANTMAYRIPTQAVSSIHALRFVDVVPVLRDTIILPKEFTKITGSDFKQYWSH